MVLELQFSSRVYISNHPFPQVFNYLLGSLARVFTTLQEVDDKLILYGFLAGFVLNLILALQMVYYWNALTPQAKGKENKKEALLKQTASPAQAATSSAADIPRASTPTPKSKGPTTRRRG